MNNKTKYWSLGIFVVVIGFAIFLFYPNSQKTGVANPSPSGTDLTGTGQTATSTNQKPISYIIAEQTVTLVNGESVLPAPAGSSAKVTTKYFGNSATGDLNGDGISDIAFILTQNSGGSGTFYYVVATFSTPDGFVGTNAVLLGDRISPQTTEIKNGQIIVNYADRKAGEPMTTSPSLGVSKYLRLIGNKLTDTANPDSTSVLYKNSDYGITFSLPTNWQGYSIIKSTWNGTALGNSAVQNGAKIIIRNPKWTEAVHYEDIPVLVFTLSQWSSYLAEDFSVSAAPIPASELGQNDKYVFALPPRRDYDFSLGYKEAEEPTGAPQAEHSLLRSASAL
ncbi:MAG: hypothetical protein WCP15_03355, partial [bacterium]